MCVCVGGEEIYRRMGVGVVGGCGGTGEGDVGAWRTSGEWVGGGGEMVEEDDRG